MEDADEGILQVIDVEVIHGKLSNNYSSTTVKTYYGVCNSHYSNSISYIICDSRSSKR